MGLGRSWLWRCERGHHVMEREHTTLMLADEKWTTSVYGDSILPEEYLSKLQ